ncbi:MAG: protein kinase domain-containing protein [Acidobacteriaceae bacterium]
MERTLVGPYELLDKLGSGGMGVVFRARDTRLHREVAIKLLHEGYLGAGTPGTNSQERFLREARAASALNHPNICTIHDVGEQEGKPYLVMELLQGRTLREILNAQPLPCAQIVEFGIQLARAMEEAHQAGIIHRDIKPANIFVVRAQQGSQQIKVLDFGLAKITVILPGVGTSGDSSDSTEMAATIGETLTMPGSTFGTIAYMSPEQARGQPLDLRTDLFSLGAVLYEMATGGLPFPGDSNADILASLLAREPEPIRKLNPAIPKDLERIILKLLAKDKAQRYQSASEVRADLEKLAGRPSTSRSSVAIPPRQKSNTFRNLAAAGLIVLLLAAGAIYWWSSHRHAPPASTAAPVTGEKDSIILSDFSNQTGDPVFDTTLNQALAIQLEQSPLLTIVSENHLRQSLQYLGKSPTDKITPEIAREIGIREGIKAIINGTISKLGSQYIITLEAVSTATGDPIGSEQAQAADKEHVLASLDQATTAMRARLGESLSSIQKLDTPFGQATTSSLEAFRAYALGDVEHLRGRDIPEAEEHYKRAVDLDPKFAMAWARLGVVYSNSGAVGKAQQYFQKAYDLSGSVSEREKLYIAGHYYTNVTGDLPRVIETLELGTRTYPRNLDYWINLGAAYSGVGDLEKTKAVTEHALSMQADDAIGTENYVQTLVALDQLTEARQVAERALQSPIAVAAEFRQFLVPLYTLLGDQAGVQRQIDWAAGNNQEFLINQVVAQSREYQGRYREADALYQKAFDQAEQQKFSDVAAGITLSRAQGKAIAGMCNDVPARIKRALSLDRSPATIRTAGLSAALCGEAKLVMPLLEDLARKYPQDTLTNTLALPQTRAADDLLHHRPDQALHDLEAMGSYNLISQQEYLRGLAYLDLHNGANAAEAFRKVTSHRGATLANFLQDFPQAQLGLARALAMQGDKSAARKAYQDFFATWKNADPTLPQLAAAKVEFANLH